MRVGLLVLTTAIVSCAVVASGGSVSTAKPRAVYKFQQAEPHWSSDGQSIAFVDYRPENRGGTVIAVMNASDGTRQRRLPTRSASSGPEWSPDGTRIAYTESDGIYVIRADGTGRTRVTDDGGAVPSWSPNGRRIVYAVHSAVWVVNADGSGRRQLMRPPAPQGSDGFPDWSPDGNWIAFYRNDGSGANFGLNIARSDGTGVRALTFRSQDIVPEWSPNGRRIAFTRASGFRRETWVVDADGSDLQEVAKKAAFPSWSPDGSRLAFSRRGGVGTTGPTNVHLMGTDGTGLVRLPFRRGCSVTGTEGTDVLPGTNGDDVICGLGGNDYIVGITGADRILGGAGNDVILGQAGDDRLFGGAGRDELVGGGGRDRLYGGAGGDVLRSSRDSEPDLLDGGSGIDRAYPHGGDRRISIELRGG